MNLCIGEEFVSRNTDSSLVLHASSAGTLAFMRIYHHNRLVLLQ